LKKLLIDILKALFFLSIGLLLIWLVTKDLTSDDKTNIYLAFQNANYFWIVLGMFLSALSHWSRAVRWKILLAPLGHHPKTSTTFFAVMIGYLANFALPRLGEVSRCGVLTKYEKIPFTESFGTVITERIIDMLCLLLIFAFTIILEFEKIYSLVDKKILAPLQIKLSLLTQNKMLLLVVFGVFMIVLFIIYKFRKVLNAKLFGKFPALMKGFFDGISSVRNIKNPLLFLAHTLFIWVMYTLILFVCFYSFPEISKLGFGAAFSVLIFGSVGIIFVPGGTGVYQALVTEVLTVSYLITFATAFAFSWIVWTSSLVVILILGLISLVLLPIVNKEKK
jgi:glycosyltransferase 2 family protein